MGVPKHKHWVWLADRSQRAFPAEDRFVTSRRLTMPELLEGRNAPSAMLPFASVFGAVSSADVGEGLLLEDPSGHEPPAYYRSSGAQPSVEPISIQSLVLALRATEAEGQKGQSEIDAARETTEFRTPAEFAAVNAAFDSFTTGSFDAIFFDARLIPPPVIHPVEPPEDEPQEVHELPTMPELVSESSPAGSIGAVVIPPVQEFPITPGDDASATPVVELPPPLVQPVITDPESEHNRPGPEPVPEAAPPLIQPVIMDPDSEHNQELVAANFAE